MQLTIIYFSFQRFYITYSKEIQLRDKERKEQSEQISKLNASNSELLAQKSKVEYNLNKCEYKLSSIKSELELNYKNLIEKIKLKYKKEIRLVRERLDELTSKYKAKSAELVKSQKSLEQLRIHFMTNSFEQHKINDNFIKT